MKKTLFLLFLVILSCKAKERFLEPSYVLAKWAKATQSLSYQDYRQCEAFPKSHEVFREMYQEYYLADVAVGKIEDLDTKDIKKDIDGNSYYGRNVTFECTEMSRKTQKAVKLIRGHVQFIKYLTGARKSENWLMYNRTLIRIGK